ncbi:DUF1565 domain-containing protein, partial [Myxococcota bacterium]|nr:DUF1565 domain-containing protein [Myxococcota bacterium]
MLLFGGCLDLDALPPACFPGECDPCPDGRCPPGYIQEVEVDCLTDCQEALTVADEALTLCLLIEAPEVIFAPQALRPLGEGSYLLDPPLDLTTATRARLLAQAAPRCAGLAFDAPCEDDCALALSLDLESLDVGWLDVGAGAVLRFERATCEAMTWNNDEIQATCEAAWQRCDDPEDGARVGERCVEGLGVCEAEGRYGCAWGALICDAIPGEAGVELADDGLDNDCDGSVDESDETPPERCDLGEERFCGLNEGVCGLGTQRCELRSAEDGEMVGLYGDCLDSQGAPVIGPSVEICDGLDNDCDGQIDDGLALDSGEAVGARCAVGIGGCRAQGRVICGANHAPLCDATAGPASLEQPGDGVDNDCDGEVDEAISDDDCAAGEIRACGLGVGVCLAGTRTCEVFEGDPRFGRLGPCLDAEGAATLEPSEEICDGLDNDCDGTTDEGLGGGVCVVGQGLCRREGTRICAPPEGLRCDVEPGPVALEICDGFDNDCDGVVDNGFDLNSDPNHCGACNLSCAQPHAEMGCAARRCAFLSCDEGFVDANNNIEDGCECDNSAPDDPDPDFIDANCDGIDGREALVGGGRALFASPNVGRPGGAGTRADPLRDLEAAVALAHAGDHIYLDQGVYTLSATLEIPAGVSLYGGYDASNQWQTRSNRWVDGAKTVITGASIVLKYPDTSPPMDLDQVEIVALDAGPGGEMSAPLWVESGEGLRLRRVRLISGRGAQGESGAAGPAPASEGSAGQTAVCDGCAGPAGENLSCSAADGSPGGVGGPLNAAGESNGGALDGAGGGVGLDGERGL